MTSRDLHPDRLVEATTEELVEAAERIDAGLRRVSPQLYAVPDTPAPEPAVNQELAETVLAKLGDARTQLFEAMKLVDRLDDPLAHFSIAEFVNALDSHKDTLAERWQG